MLGAELTEHLGYEHGQEAPPVQTNRRYGTTRKSVKGEDGAFEISVLHRGRSGQQARCRSPRRSPRGARLICSAVSTCSPSVSNAWRRDGSLLEELGYLPLAQTGGQLLFQLISRLIAMVRAKVEHPFRVLKRQFGQVKTRYRGLAKNRAQLFTLFALGNLYLMRRKLLA